MDNRKLGMFLVMLGIIAIVSLCPELSFAQLLGGSSFESKLQGLTSSIINVILPAVSILGLVYSAILASIGDGMAKQRIIFIISASIIGFLAPIIISWFKSVAGG